MSTSISFHFDERGLQQQEYFGCLLNPVELAPGPFCFCCFPLVSPRVILLIFDSRRGPSGSILVILIPVEFAPGLFGSHSTR